MIAAIVAPAGLRSIARMRACLVSGSLEVFGDECADRERALDLLVVRAAERAEVLDLDLDFVMGSSEVMRRHPPHHLSPARAIPRQGKTPEGPEAIGLDSIGDDRKQQMPRQMIGRWSLEHALPPRAQTFEIETAQMHDLVLNRCLGRDTTIAMLLLHALRPPA